MSDADSTKFLLTLRTKQLGRGNGTLSQPLLRFLIENAQEDQRGHSKALLCQAEFCIN